MSDEQQAAPVPPIMIELGIPRYSIGQYAKLNGQPISPVPLKLIPNAEGPFMKAGDVIPSTTIFMQRTTVYLMKRFIDYLVNTKGQTDEERIAGIPKMFAPNVGVPDGPSSGDPEVSSEGEPAGENRH